MKHTHLILALGLSIMASSCKEFIQTEDGEFFERAEILGIDANCSEGTDVISCESLPGCQPAYGENPDGGIGGFEGCVADPDYHPDDSGSASGGTTAGASTGSVSGGSSSSGSVSGGSVSGGTVSGGSVSGGSASGGSVSGGSSSGGSYTSGSVSGGESSGGSSSGGSYTSGSVSGGSTGGSDEPTLDDVQPNCHGVDSQYLYVKKMILKHNKGAKYIAKVKVCHETAKSRHTIVIACPAVKAHREHHSDKLGVCQ